MPTPDLIWKPLTPLLQQMESLQGVMDLCARYLPRCTVCAVGLAGLILIGIVLATRRMPKATTEPTVMRDAVPA